jgi:hypothetical protein
MKELEPTSTELDIGSSPLSQPEATEVYLQVRHPFRKGENILCEVELTSMPGRFVAFLATPDDPEMHGREIHARCLAGEFGEIPDYVDSDSECIANASQKAAHLLQQANTKIAPLQDLVDIEQANAETIAALKVWKRFRVDLNRIDQQPGYPRDIAWPAIPQT